MKNRRSSLPFILAAGLLLALAGTTPSWAADVNKLLRNAMKFYEKGDYDKAIKQFVKVLEVDPNHSMAREYMMLCSQKIVEKKLGAQTAEAVEKEVAVEKQIQGMSFAGEPPAADEGQADGLEEPATPEIPPADNIDFKALLASAADAQPTEARDILQQREAVSDELRRRHLGTENIVQIEEDRGQFEVTFYMNRLFLPYTDTLRDEAYPVLNHVTARIRTNMGRKVVFKAVDATSQAVQTAMPDLSNKRSTALFAYLLYNAYRPDSDNLLAAKK